MALPDKGKSFPKNVPRKELRKMKRLEKKQKKVNYFSNKTKNLKERLKTVEKPGKHVRKPIDSENSVKPSKGLAKARKSVNDERPHNSVVDNEHELEKKKLNKLEKQMKKQRIKALTKENEMEDKTIKQLEKKLKLNKRKSNKIPKSFIDCGLDYILDVCDAEKLQDAVAAERNLGDSDSEFEEDLALITGKSNEITKGRKSSNKKLKKPIDTEECVSDEDSDLDDEGNDVHDSSDDELSSDNEMTFDNDEDSSEETPNPSPVKQIQDSNQSANVNRVKNIDIKGILKKSSIHEENSESNRINKLNKKRNSSENEPCDATSLKKRVRIEENIESKNDDDGPEKELEEKGTNEYWEDIYGRTRDKSGNVVKVSSEKYVPPNLREKSDNENSKRREELEKIKKQLKGLLNRLAENNMHSISSQIDEMYMKNSRNDMNGNLLSLYQDSLLVHVHAPERLVMEHAMLIAILHANVGTEIGAFFLQNLLKTFDEVHSKGNEIEDKQLDNLLLLISHMYTFKIYNCELLYDILNRLSSSFTPKDIDLILVILRSVGFSLRKDDPIALKLLILNIQKLANDVFSIKDDARFRFMLDVLLGIKNNNMNKIPGYDPTHAEHLKKIIKTMFRKGNYVTELKISLDDILKADERGRWWIVGSAWSGPSPNSAEKSFDKDQQKPIKSLPSYSQEILDLAKKLRMNTVNRKNIFCTLMTAEDYLDAFEKLLKLGLKGQPEQEIVHVLIHCLLREKTYNPYYSFIAEQLCMSDRRHQMSIQYSVWDRFKELASLKNNQITNLAKFLAHLFLQKSLPISVLKVVEFVELDKPGVRLIRQVLMSLLLHNDKDATLQVFTRIAKPSKLSQFRKSLALFMHHFILRKNKPSENQDVAAEEKLLHSRVDEVIKAMDCFNVL